MKEFRSIEDVDAAGLAEDVSVVVRGTLECIVGTCAEAGGKYDPTKDGYTVLVEAGDADDVIRAAIGGHTLRDAVFEGVTYSRGHFVTCVLFNNQFGVSIVVPDAPWLDPVVRERLMREL
jgi:hypothetical protein